MRAPAPSLLRFYRLDEMARQREDAMWQVLDWAATQAGEFTIRDLYRVWAQAGGGGESASYQQFSTAINNYIYKFDPRSPTAKYRNPRYKFIRVGKSDRGSVPAPLEFVTHGARGAGNAAVLRWRQGIPPMRQPSPPKTPIHSEDDPVGGALDSLERRLGRPALKASMARWRQLGDLHKISADIMADVQIRGKDKMLALQVAADSLVSKGKATQTQVSHAEDEMEDEVGDTGERQRTPFSSPIGSGGFDEDEPTQRDASPMGAGDEEMPDDLLHGDDDEGAGEASGSPSEGPADQGTDTEPPAEDDDGVMRGSLIGTDGGGHGGERIPVTIRYDEDDGASVEREGGDPVGPYEGFKLEVANGVLTQDAFDDLEEDGWDLVAAEEARADSSDEESGGEDGDPDGDGDSGEGEEPEEKGGSIEASDDTGTGEFPTFLPDPDEQGDRYERAMFELVTGGAELEPKRCREDDPLWEEIRGSKDSSDAHQVIMRSGLPRGLQKYALTVARAIFQNTGRDFDTGKKSEGRLLGLYGLAESPLQEPVDFDQESGLERLYRVRRSRR